MLFFVILLSVGLLFATERYLRAAFTAQAFRLLGDDTPSATAELPISVVIPARNEAAAITATLAALRKQRPAPLEVIVVDDRSEDETAERVREAADRWSALRLVTVQRKPDDWLGKPHALQRGIAESRQRWLLLMDADVELTAPDLLGRAWNEAHRAHVDQLTLLPSWRAPTGPGRWWLSLVQWSGFFLMLVGTRAHTLTKPTIDRRRHPFGLGAFNLVRRRALEDAGGPAAFAQSVLDDVALARALGASGAYRMVRIAREVVVPWHPDRKTLQEAFQRNFAAFCGYSRIRMLVSGLALTLFVMLPVAALLFALLAWNDLSSTGETVLFLSLGLSLSTHLILLTTRINSPFKIPPLRSMLGPLGQLGIAALMIRSAFYNSERLLWRGDRIGPPETKKGDARLDAAPKTGR